MLDPLAQKITSRTKTKSQIRSYFKLYSKLRVLSTY